MHYVIPLSGLGSRFAAEGYTDIKPLIPVRGRPIISWVLDMVPRADKVSFICRPSHLETTPLRKVLMSLRPDAVILQAPDDRTGPVGHLLHVADAIADDEPLLVSYCDYYMQWDAEAFLRECAARGCAGAVPCYAGFHPHLLPEKNLYACCRVDGSDNLREIREKHTFTVDKTLSRHSPGMYWYKSGALFKTYARELMDTPALLIGGEGYNSMMYQPMVDDGLAVWAPANVRRFCQWGTPQDLRDFAFWMSQPAVADIITSAQ